ncbi:MAG: hypothetical protein A2Y40_02200 [Candidatus Margulisbacteria bacterium GWF2_35_9]|nr:MAG: hypothetical protein A2Y40_02200 [Candidatus Margulisbacteria bacterium GWF2_35_9]
MKKILVVSAVVLMTSFVLAAEENLIEELNLSNQQVKQIQTQQRNKLEIQTQLHQQLQVREQELKLELGKAEPNVERIQTLKQEMTQLREHQLDNEVEGTLEMKKIMTKQQLQKMEKLQLQTGSGLQNQNKIQTQTNMQNGSVGGNAGNGRKGH